MIFTDFYPEVESACHALGALLSPVLTENAAALGLTFREANYLLAIPSFEPNPVSPAMFRVRSPYTAERVFTDCLNSMLERGYVEPADACAYHITDAGLKAVAALNRSIYTSISSFQTLQNAELIELAERLKLLSDACARTAEPPGHWSIEHTRRLDPGAGAAFMVQVDQHLTELAAFRDDAHLASWKGLISEGHAWDILTLLWAGQEFTAEKINVSLSRRRNSLEQTKIALVQLFKKGWVEIQEMNVHISDLGVMIRKAAEEKTNQAFYAPFTSFGHYELERTYELLKKHRREIPAI